MQTGPQSARSSPQPAAAAPPLAAHFAPCPCPPPIFATLCDPHPGAIAPPALRPLRQSPGRTHSAARLGPHRHRCTDVRRPQLGRELLLHELPQARLIRLHLGGETWIDLHIWLPAWIPGHLFQIGARHIEGTGQPIEVPDRGRDLFPSAARYLGIGHPHLARHRRLREPPLLRGGLEPLRLSPAFAA